MKRKTPPFLRKTFFERGLKIRTETSNNGVFFQLQYQRLEIIN